MFYGVFTVIFIFVILIINLTYGKYTIEKYEYKK